MAGLPAAWARPYISTVSGDQEPVPWDSDKGRDQKNGPHIRGLKASQGGTKQQGHQEGQQEAPKGRPQIFDPRTLGHLRTQEAKGYPRGMCREGSGHCEAGAAWVSGCLANEP